MIAIIDYDAGNMKSVEKAFQYLNEDAVITRDRKAILEADRVVLPGVGAFGDAMERLHSYDLVETIQDAVKSGKPFLGICLGCSCCLTAVKRRGGKGPWSASGGNPSYTGGRRAEDSAYGLEFY